MCEKRPNEPWLAYMCRYVVEQPQAVLAVIGIAAAIVLYCDLRSFIAELAEAQEKTIRVLSEMSVRLQTIEHRMEVYHMQPPPVTQLHPRLPAVVLRTQNLAHYARRFFVKSHYPKKGLSLKSDSSFNALRNLWDTCGGFMENNTFFFPLMRIRGITWAGTSFRQA